MPSAPAGPAPACRARLLRKRLITTAAQVRAALRAGATRQRAVSVDLLRVLDRPARTTQMRAAASAHTFADLARSSTRSGATGTRHRPLATGTPPT